MSGTRPEHISPPELFYDTTEASKYTQNTRIKKIQRELTERAIELLGLPTLAKNETDSDDGMEDSANIQTDPKLILDIGCGSGLSGEILASHGHTWFGCDISQSMLDVAMDREVENCDLLLHDMGHSLPFRSGTFDGAISISALQWLCNQDKSVNKPAKRLKAFFESLYSCLKHGAKAVLQFYPENPEQSEFIWSFATKAGFSGGVLIDFPNSQKRKKYYLVLFCGVQQQNMPDSLDGTEQPNTAKFAKKERLCDLRKKGKITKKQWIMAKKDKQRAAGKQVANDSKFTDMTDYGMSAIAECTIKTSNKTFHAKLDINGEHVSIETDEDTLKFSYPELQLFATGSDPETNEKFLLMLVNGGDEDDDGDLTSIEYKVYTDNIDAIYEALQKNQELHPDPPSDEEPPVQGFGCMAPGPNGDAGQFEDI